MKLIILFLFFALLGACFITGEFLTGLGLFLLVLAFVGGGLAVGYFAVLDRQDHHFML